MKCPKCGGTHYEWIHPFAIDPSTKKPVVQFGYVCPECNVEMVSVTLADIMPWSKINEG